MIKRIEPTSIFQYDENIRLKNPILAGIDEAGRGPLAGPVVAAAVILPSGLVIRGLRDSKQTSENERNRFFWEITSSALNIGVGIVTADIIDKINILNSTKHAMAAAVRDLKLKPDILMIDAVNLPDVGIEQESIIKGESISSSIAAASIVAKVVRDDIMFDYHEKYPAYEFRQHKGYCTKKHVELLRLHGPCPIHRRSFKVPDTSLSLK
ncbi:MAG: ribonuclease HII [Nitrospirae bacterium]|nr:ribonuclease HII [Nitrospirota bacterium]